MISLEIVKFMVTDTDIELKKMASKYYHIIRKKVEFYSKKLILFISVTQSQSSNV